MSQPPPFPLPPAQGQPIPVQPISPPYATAVQPLPPMIPIPVQSLTFGGPTARRPGLITAIGIMSIIVGSLTILSTAVQGLQTLMMFAFAQSSATMARINANTTVAAEEADAGWAAVSEDGFSNADDRETVLTGLTRARLLPPERRRQLDALLLDGGKEMFLLRGPQLTALAIQSNVSDSGRKFADDGNGAEFFLVGQGEIEVYDDHAVFYPSDGGEMISASAAVSDDPTDANEAATGDNGVSDPQTTSAVAPVPAPFVAATMPAPPAMGAGFNKPALAVLLIERLISLALAVYLLVIGIMVLRQSPRGRRLHRVYALAKIPLALIGGWATWALWTGFASGFGRMAAAAITPWIVAITLLACAYPIALLIVLRSRTAREYYDSVKPE